MRPSAADAVEDRHHALANPLRTRLLELLRGHGPGDGTEHEPAAGRDAGSLAADLDVHVNTVRFHLDILQRAGLVASRAETRRVRGRPRMLFHVVPPQDAGTDEDRYRFLASVLTDALEDEAVHPAELAERAGERWGARLVERRVDERSGRAGDPVDVAVAILDELGFEPRIDPSSPARIELHRCPYRRLAVDHLDVVCGVHLGLLRGALADGGVAMDDITLTPFVTDTMCVATLGD